MNIRCYIGLGSNLQHPRRQIAQAVKSLEQSTGIYSLRLSPLYESAALGPGRQANYINAVAEITTDLSPEHLLKSLQAQELTQGRVRDQQRWTARTLDLDLLLYGDRVINTRALQVPHPRLAQRQFVMLPLQDLAPDLRIPGLGALSALIDACGSQPVWRMSLQDIVSVAEENNDH